MAGMCLKVISANDRTEGDAIATVNVYGVYQDRDRQTDAKPPQSIPRLNDLYGDRIANAPA
jgi:hypothetical protein